MIMEPCMITKLFIKKKSTNIQQLMFLCKALIQITNVHPIARVDHLILTHEYLGLHNPVLLFVTTLKLV